MNRIPTIEDWGNYTFDTDQRHAFSIFGEKSNVELQSDFYRNVIERCDELRFMPEIPFRYYILGLRDYVLAREFPLLGGADAASCFLHLIEEKLTGTPSVILPVMDQLISAIKYIGENQKLYGASEKNLWKFL